MIARNPPVIVLLLGMVGNLALAADEFALMKKQRIGPLRLLDL
jgi:hypothetical protein